MQTTEQRLAGTIAEKTTETLIDVIRRLNLQTDSAACLTCNMISRELEKRMPEPAFVALMEDLYNQLMTTPVTA